MRQGYENLLIWSHFKPICTKMFCGIFTQSFDAFWGHSNILKIYCKAVSTTASSTKFLMFLQIMLHFKPPPYSMKTGYYHACKFQFVNHNFKVIIYFFKGETGAVLEKFFKWKIHGRRNSRWVKKTLFLKSYDEK